MQKLHVHLGDTPSFPLAGSSGGWTNKAAGQTANVSFAELLKRKLEVEAEQQTKEEAKEQGGGEDAGEANREPDPSAPERCLSPERAHASRRGSRSGQGG
jgi:hypothetical protein